MTDSTVELNQNLNAKDLLEFTSKVSLPLVLQSEIAECGLASLAMVASYYGKEINLPPLRRTYKLDSHGLTLKDMITIADDMDLASRALKCDLADVSKLSLPCILHWNMNHFVVLTGITRRGIHINDPAAGKRTVTLDEFSNQFTGIALELSPTATFKRSKMAEQTRITDLWDRISGIKQAVTTVVVLSLLLQTATLLSPYYMQWVVDQVLISNDTPLLFVLAFGFALLLLIEVGVSIFRSLVLVRFSSLLNIQMGANVFNHMIKLPMTFFEQRHTGDILSKFNSVHAIREFLTTGVAEAVTDGIMALIVLYMMYLYSPLMMSLVLAVVIASGLLQWLFYYKQKELSQKFVIDSANEQSHFLESIRAVQTIKLFSHEIPRQNGWLNKYAKVINSDIKLTKLNLWENSLSRILFGLENILVIYFGATLAIEGSLTVGMLFAFIAYKLQFTSAISNLINQLVSFKLLSVHIDRLSDIVLHKKEKPSNLVSTLPNEDAILKADSISFRYADNAPWIIENLSFSIYPGECVAFVGASGCGKTTLLKLILGLIQPTKGTITLGDTDINTLPPAKYRALFGTVMQADSLLAGSILDNITMYATDYEENAVVEACKRACIWEDISQLRMGLHSLVGDMGDNLSGGQLQRLFLARALYKQPRILCLDESSSHLDIENESLINQNLSDLKVTKILVAHRRESIDAADRLIRLN